MTWSRFAALALSVPLLHLNIVRADSACDQHTVQPMVQHEMPAGEMASHHHSAPSKKPAQSCDTPAQAECCQAVVSCSPGLGELAATVAIMARPAGIPATHSIVMPRSRVTPPEPPPPRS